MNRNRIRNRNRNRNRNSTGFFDDFARNEIKAAADSLKYLA
jgi:hypothetical protein